MVVISEVKGKQWSSRRGMQLLFKTNNEKQVIITAKDKGIPIIFQSFWISSNALIFTFNTRIPN